MRRPLIDAMLSDETVEALLSDESQLEAMLRVEIALAKAEATAGLISDDAARAIERGLGEFAPDWDDLAEGMRRDGVMVPRLVAQMRAAVGSEHAAALHKGATSQDIVDTALMLQLGPILGLYYEHIEALLSGLRAVTARDGAKPLMAHTRMQPALPFTVAAKLRAWIEPLEQHRRDLAATTGLLSVQLGGPIGDRSSFAGTGDTIAAQMAEELGLADAPCWHASRTRIVTIGGHVSALSGTLGKIGADVGLLALTGAVAVAGGGTSSAMAHKSNPVAAEHLVALAHQNAALVGALHHAMVHENERSGAAWTLEWLTLPQMLRNTAGALRIATDLAQAITFR